MTRRLLVVLCFFAALLAVALPAAAQTPDQVAAEVADRGYWIDPALPADDARISSAVAAAGNAGVRLFVVLLDEDPAGGATTFADAVLDRIGDGTVLVLSATSEGMASLDFDQDQIEAALDAGYGAGGGDVGYLDAVVASLTGTPVGPGDGGEATGGGSKTGLIVLLLVVGGLVLLVVWAVRRQGKATKAGRQRSLEEARQEIKSQLDAMANTILEISDKVSLSDSREDNQYLEQAGRTYTEASEAYETATDPARLEEISDRLDEARWQLDAAAALAEGKPAPAKPTAEERSACFFDPTHGGPFENAEVRTAAGAKTVRVCVADAEKLRRGQRPDTRMIEVGGRDVPAATAPKSYGGGGLDWLDLFAVIVGGMGAGRSFDWGSGRTSGTWGRGTRSGSWGSGSGSRRIPSSGGSVPRVRARAGRIRMRRR
ncbi:MAG TPA: DUF6676 family protein [Acidimicrobiia bacterium]|nr:DUF6676 family protein [Acidimicrobiia bacterium]